MGTFGLSDGSRLDNDVIDRRCSKAKHDYKVAFIDKKGYLFSERSGNNGDGLAASHIISVKWAKEHGMSELCWDLKNLEILTQKEHMEFENLGNAKREEWYHARLRGERYSEWRSLF